MISSAETLCLPDVNVWLALAWEKHVHNLAARRWFDHTSDRVFFCRITQMAFLRLLTSTAVMGPEARSVADAIPVYEEFLNDARVSFASEPELIERMWLSLMAGTVPKGSNWTDAYLAAFAKLGNYRLVTFDRGMRRWPNVHVLETTTAIH